MRIKTIIAKKRPPHAMALELENGDTLVLHVEVVMRHGLFAGGDLDGERLEAALRDDEMLRCRETAWRLLSLRPRTRLELTRSLRQRKFLKSTAEQVAQELEQKGFLNDATFARVFAEERARKQHGPRLIEVELRARGVDREAAKEAVQDYAGADRQAEDARDLLRKWNRRSKPEDTRKRKQAAAQFLARRGYDQDVIWDAVRAVVGGEEED